MAGLIFDESPHYLDHLAPLCSLLHVPLIICDPQIANLARRYYPDLEVIEEDLRTLSPPHRVITCSPRPLLEASLFRQPQETLWIPHGHSDKPPCFETLHKDTAAVVYGLQMEQWIKAANPTLPIHRIGNFRYHYFLKHRNFYSQLLPKIYGPVFLYTPTWDDYEKSNSFWSCFPPLAEALPDTAVLLIKLHPNTYRQFPERVEVLKGRYEKKNIRWIEDFPPIHPLLSLCDAYIGDMSSIGYDFLTWDKPLFFFSHRPTALGSCGVHVKPEKVFEAYQQPDRYSFLRKTLYAQTFDATLRLPEVK